MLIADAVDNEPMLDYRSWARDKGLGFTRSRPPRWHQWVPIRIRAMVLAGDHLYAAGPPDLVPEEDPYAAIDGRRGAILRTVSAKDGSRLAEHPLQSPPVFDGLAAAAGRLYMSTIDGKLLCLSEAK